MEFRCKSSLYWHQYPGFDGLLNRKVDKRGNEKVTLEFEASKSYEIYPVLGDNGRSILSLMAIGNSGQVYCLFQINVMGLGPLGYFDLSHD